LLTALLALALLLTACGSGDDDSSTGTTGGTDAPGAACTSDFEGGCPSTAKLCYAVGASSSCKNGGLCAGTGTEPLACAYGCKSDADCAALAEPGLVCLLGCTERLFNGFCTTPAARDELATHPLCTEPSPGRRSVAGVSY
jgi:hypothetical protein